MIYEMAVHGENIQMVERAEVLTPEHLLRVTDTVATSAKILTLAALDMTSDTFIGHRQLCRQMNSLQDDRLGWDFTRHASASPLDYSQRLFRKLGLVEMGKSSGSKRLTPTIRITPAGSELWPALAGMYMIWERDHPTMSLADIVGDAKSALRFGASSRLRALDYLLSSPADCASQADIKYALGISYDTASKLAADLARLGIVRYETKILPEERKYVVLPPRSIVKAHFNSMHPELQAMVTAISQFQADELPEVDGLQIIRQALKVNPDLDTKKAWGYFLDWHGDADRNAKLLEEIPFSDQARHRTKLSVEDAYAEPLKRLLDDRRRLAQDADYRQALAKEGRKYTSNRQRMTNHMRRARSQARIGQRTVNRDWSRLLYSYVPPEGIAIDALRDVLEQTEGVAISKPLFMQYIFDHPDVVRVVDRAEQEGVVKVGHIVLRKYRFTEAWPSQSLCRGDNVNPDIFHEQDNTPQGKANTKEALAACRKCPVRMACLKTAVENEETMGVWGGMTADTIKTLTPAQKAMISKVVTIG